MRTLLGNYMFDHTFLSPSLSCFKPSFYPIPPQLFSALSQPSDCRDPVFSLLFLWWIHILLLGKDTSFSGVRFGFGLFPFFSPIFFLSWILSPKTIPPCLQFLFPLMHDAFVESVVLLSKSLPVFFFLIIAPGSLKFLSAAISLGFLIMIELSQAYCAIRKPRV